MKGRILKNKFVPGIATFLLIIILLSSIIAVSIIYDANVSANAVKQIKLTTKENIVQEFDDIKDLSLNEGWYSIKNGFVFYLQDFDNAIPLYMKIENPGQQNGKFSVDSDGSIDLRRTVKND